MEIVVTVVVLAEIEARVVEELGVVVISRVGRGFKEVGAVRGGNGGDGIDPDHAEDRRPDGKTDFQDTDADLREKVVETPQPEQKGDKQRGKEQVENDVVAFKNHKLACEIRLVKDACLKKAHDADIAEREKDKETENIDNDELSLVCFLDGWNGCRLLRFGGGSFFVFTH